VAQARRKPRIWSFAIQIVPGPDSRQAIASQALSGIRKVLYRTPVVQHIDRRQMAASRAIEGQERETLRNTIANMGNAGGAL